MDKVHFCTFKNLVSIELFFFFWSPTVKWWKIYLEADWLLALWSSELCIIYRHLKKLDSSCALNGGFQRTGRGKESPCHRLVCFKTSHSHFCWFPDCHAIDKAALLDATQLSCVHAECECLCFYEAKRQNCFSYHVSAALYSNLLFDFLI